MYTAGRFNCKWKNFLGRKVVQGSALYLAFEDHKTMIQKRLKRMGIKPNDQFVIDVLKSNSEFDLNTRNTAGKRN